MNDKTAAVPLGMNPVNVESPGISQPPGAGLPAKAKSRISPLRILGVAVALYAVVVITLGVLWSHQPATFHVAALQSAEVDAQEGRPVPGTAVVAAAIGVAETLLNKPGGFLHNDVTPPGLYLDNMPKWEYGALKELRDSVHALRNDFSRSQTQSVESDYVKRADVKLAIDASSWLLPAAEEEYGQAVDALRAFLGELSRGQDSSARFYTRADNLAAYLAIVEKRLGSLALRLSSSVGDSELTAALVQNVDGQSVDLDERPVDPRGPGTPWHLVDDIYYESRGYTWALLHMMKAISIDFADILSSKNADASIAQIIRDLDGASRPMVSPIVLNGHGYGFLANHSLVMASYISRANAAVLDLRILLQQG